MVKSTTKAIDLFEERLRDVPWIESIHRVACVSEDLIYPEKGYRPQPKYNKYWCPYCGGEHTFVQIKDGYLNCEVCRISDRDFYVSKINGLGDLLSAADKARTKARRQVKVQRKKTIKKLKEETAA